MSELPEYVLALIDKIAEDEGFTDTTKEFQAGSKHGDNFLGLLTSVILRGVQHGSPHAELHLLCKLAPENVHRREAFNISAAFRREMFVYKKIFPVFLKFQREKGLNDRQGFTAYPKCYAAIADEESGQFLVIMEDLRSKEYGMWPKHLAIPLDHSRLLMEQLGRLHAVSFAMKDQQPTLFEEFKALDDLFTPMFDSPTLAAAIENSFKRTVDAITNKEHAKKMRELANNWRTVFSTCLSGEDAKKFGVISHGDCWNNNLLYKYDDQNNVDSVILVDWQLCRYTSPCIDILYNLFTSTDRKLRESSYQHLLKCYHSSLTETIEVLGSDPKILFTFEDLENELKQFGKYAYLSSPLLLRIMLADPNHIPNFEDMKEPNEEPSSNRKHTMLYGSAQLAYNERLNDIVEDLISYGY